MGKRRSTKNSKPKPNASYLQKPGRHERAVRRFKTHAAHIKKRKRFK
jgi:hypothetical protein